MYGDLYERQLHSDNATAGAHVLSTLFRTMTFTMAGTSPTSRRIADIYGESILGDDRRSAACGSLTRPAKRSLLHCETHQKGSKHTKKKHATRKKKSAPRLAAGMR